MTVTYSITVSGPGGTVSASVDVTVQAMQLTPVDFKIGPADFTYNGGSQGPTIAPTVNGATYTVTGDSTATDANTYSLHVEAYGDYEGSAECTWTIHPKPVNFSFGNLSQEYDGSGKSASVSCSDSSATFNSSLSGGPNADNYGVSAEAYGNYTGSGSDTLTINQVGVYCDWSNNPSGYSYTYDGSSHGLWHNTSHNGVVSGSGTDNATDAGSYSYTYTLNDTTNYYFADSNSQSWSIDPKPVSFSFSDLSYTYDGSTHTASVSSDDPNATYNSDLTKGPAPGSYTVSASAYGNYTGDGSDTLTIDQPISTSFSFSPASFVYDTKSHAVSVAASPGDATFDTTGTTPATEVGTYSLTAAAYGSYSGTATWTWKITPKPVTFTFDAPTATYNGKPHAATVTPSDAAATFAVTYTGTAGTIYAASINPPIAAGSYIVSAVASGNYTGSGSAPLMIAKAPLAVTANIQTKIYGTSNPALTYTLSGFVNGETASVVSGTASVTTTATGSSGVGMYAIVPVVGSLAAANYAFATFTNGTLSVTPAAVTVTANSKTRGYGAGNPAFDATYAGFVNGDTAAIVSGTPAFSTMATSSSPVGTYAITPTLGTLTAANYSFGPFVGGTLTIAKANLAATADNQTRLYGSTNPALTIRYAGFLNGDTVAAITPPLAYTTATQSSPVGSYPIVLSGGSATNYAITLANGTLAVTKAALAVTADNQSRTYGTANPPLTYTLAGFRNGDTAAVVSGGASVGTAATNASPVGTYAIVPGIGTLDAVNYTFGPFNSGVLTVGKAVLTATADNQSRPYGAANPTLTVSYRGFINGDTSTVLSTPVVATTSASATSPVGTYPIVPAGGAAANYSLSYVNGSLAVTSATAPVTLGNLTQVWDGAAEPATGTTMPPGLAVTLTYDGNVAVPQTAGTYTVVGTINDSNYQGSATGSFVIDKGTPVITWTPPAPITYPTPLGSAQLNAAANVPGSFVYAPGTGALLGAGTQTLSVTFTPTDTANYHSATAAVALVVHKATPVITWAAPGAITYGTPLNSAQLNASANVSGTFIYSPVADTVLGAGPQTLTATFAPGDAANFTGASASVPLTVNQAVLTVAANDVGKIYGQSNPAFTATIRGFVNGDSAAVVAGMASFSTPATAASGAGAYTITPTLGTLNAANYTFGNFVNGTLTVAKAWLTVTADDQSRVFGAPTPTLTYRISGFVNGDGMSATSGAAAVTSSATVASNIGFYPIAPVLCSLAASNYQFAFANGTLTIVPKSITFTFGDLAHTFDTTAKSATVSASDPAATFTSDLTKGPDAGTYQVTAMATGNYSGSGSANLVISPATQTITLAPTTLTVFAGETRTFSAAGGHNSYRWSGHASAGGSAADVALTFGDVGTYTVAVFNVASRNYEQSNTASATIAVVSNHQVSSLLPLESTITVTDRASPMVGQTYRRIWNESGWTAYLGRDGVRFEVKAQAWPSVKTVELQSRTPSGEWTQLAVQNPTEASTAVDAIFSVMLGTTVPGQPLVPASFASGNPQTGPWSFRARVQDSAGAWSDFSPEVPVQVILPMTTRTVSGQTVPPAGALGDWFTASPVQPFQVPLWIP